MIENPFWGGCEAPALAGGRTSSMIDEGTFRRAFGAFSFAYTHGLYLDTTVTTAWSLLDVGPEGVQGALTRQLKCLRDWLAQRKQPAAWVYVHEHAPRVGLHTHMAICLDPSLRSDFRRYIRDWACRFVEGRRPNAVEVRGAKAIRPWVHWLNFHYLMKGYDPSAEVCPEGVAPGRMTLGDLIAFPWRDPGQTEPCERLGLSRSLGPSAQARGIPGGLEACYSGPIDDYHVPIWRPTGWTWASAKDRPWPTPFLSPYDFGVRDVRLLYPPEYLAMHWRGTPFAPEPVEPLDDDLLDLPDPEDLLDLEELDKVQEFEGVSLL